jgi:hypothetical protein
MGGKGAFPKDKEVHHKITINPNTNNIRRTLFSMNPITVHKYRSAHPEAVTGLIRLIPIWQELAQTRPANPPRSIC